MTNIMYHYCALIFSTHNPFSGFWNTNSVKNLDIQRKIFILCPHFLVCPDIYQKNICYVPCKCHNRTFLPPLRLYVPFDCFRRTFLLSFCLYVPCFCHSRTFFHSPVYMSHFPYSLGYFSTFILYMSRLVLSAGFYVEQKCFAKGNPYICWFQ